MRSERPRLLFFLFLLSLLLSGCAREPGGPPATAQVTRVMDGDTVILADGTQVRLLGIDTPEMERDGRPAEFLAHQAKDFLAHMVGGKQVRLEYDQLRYDHYGRLLAYVFLPEGPLVNVELLRQGLARVYCHPPNVRYRQVLVEAQRQALEARRGLWQPPLRQDVPYYLANRNTWRFHRPGCPLAMKIAPANREKIPSLKEAYFQGFSPCRSCKP
jgi:micrococcal nuclease